MKSDRRQMFQTKPREICRMEPEVCCFQMPQHNWLMSGSMLWQRNDHTFMDTRMLIRFKPVRGGALQGVKVTIKLLFLLVAFYFCCSGVHTPSPIETCCLCRKLFRIGYDREPQMILGRRTVRAEEYRATLNLPAMEDVTAHLSIIVFTFRLPRTDLAASGRVLEGFWVDVRLIFRKWRRS